MQLPNEPGMLTLEEERETSERLRPLVDNFTEFTYSEMNPYTIARAVAAVAKAEPSQVAVQDVTDAYRLLQSEQAWMDSTRAALLTAFDGIDRTNDEAAFRATGLDRKGRSQLAQSIGGREEELRRREQIARGIAPN